MKKIFIFQFVCIVLILVFIIWDHCDEIEEKIESSRIQNMIKKQNLEDRPKTWNLHRIKLGNDNDFVFLDSQKLEEKPPVKNVHELPKGHLGNDNSFVLKSQ